MPTYIRLTDYKSSEEKERGFFKPENRYEAKQDDFEKIPGSPIAYWFNNKTIQLFSDANIKLLEEVGTVKTGMTTADNDRFTRYWYEVSKKSIFFKCQNSTEALESRKKWFPYNKGGGFRKWYGLNEYLINWENNGYEIKNNLDSKGKKKASVRAEDYYFQEAITYSSVTSASFSSRISPIGFLFDSGGSSIFFKEKRILFLTQAVLATKIPSYFLSAYNDTINFQPGDVSRIPIYFSKNEENKQNIINLVQQNIDISKEEWDSRETSWDFRINELIRMKNEVLKAQECKLEDAYNAYCDYWREKFFQLHANEEELNRLFIEIYGLQDELTPDVPLEDITILKNEAKIEGGELVFQKKEIVKQLISYGVGVMFGRYSLDHEGLHIADMGVSLEEASERFGIDHPTFEADDDNIIPVLEDDYFDDDIVGRFRAFLKAAFGKEYLDENIRFVEEALGKSLRRYFVKDFYEDHIKRYKKRPIYWMVSSPKHAFSALFYMHRYRPDIFARIQTGYLHEYMAKLEAKLADARRIALDESSSAKERKEAQKEITRIEKALKELRAFDNEALSHYAAQSEPIDLDDGVKVNYCRFKEILWPIKGLCK